MLANGTPLYPVHFPPAAFGKFLLGQNTPAAGTTSDLAAVDRPAVDRPAVDRPASPLCRRSQDVFNLSSRKPKIFLSSETWCYSFCALKNCGLPVRNAKTMTLLAGWGLALPLWQA